MMIQPYKSASTYAMENYAIQLRSCANPFPCRVKVRKPVGFLDGFFVRRSQQSPETVRCGDPISDDESALCRSCHSELTNQLTGIEEGIPLAGSPEDLQASAEIQKGGCSLGCKVVTAALIATAGVVVTGLIVYEVSTKANPSDTTLSGCVGETENCTVENVPLSSCVQITENCEVKNDCSMPIYFTTDNNSNGTEVLAGNSSVKHCALPNSPFCRLPASGNLCSTEFKVSSQDDMSNEIKLSNKYNIRKPEKLDINKIRLDIANLRADTFNATILQCDEPKKDGETCTVQSKFTIAPSKAYTLYFNLKQDHGTMRAFYTNLTGNPIEESTTSTEKFQGFDFGSKSFLNREPSPDRNKDGILAYKHTILSCSRKNTLDQTVESDDGYAYSGVLIRSTEMQLSNQMPGTQTLKVSFQEKGSYGFDNSYSLEKITKLTVPLCKTGVKVKIITGEKRQNEKEISSETINRLQKKCRVCFAVEEPHYKPVLSRFECATEQQDFC